MLFSSNCWAIVEHLGAQKMHRPGALKSSFFQDTGRGRTYGNYLVMEAIQAIS